MTETRAISLTVNGQAHPATVDVRTTLVDCLATSSA
jgi:aerobic-type carbon monoxide dehydrogenase small subunit (CoxS/CutS family)